jgi:hypothetical protein
MFGDPQVHRLLRRVEDSAGFEQIGVDRIASASRAVLVAS